MPVDVLYEGLVLARGVEVETVAEGVFVALSAPMPVGTALLVDGPGGRTAARVVRVVETGAVPGNFLAGADGGPLLLEAPPAFAGNDSASAAPEVPDGDDRTTRVDAPEEEIAAGSPTTDPAPDGATDESAEPPAAAPDGAEAAPGGKRRKTTRRSRPH